MKDKKVRAIDILRMIPCEELAKLSLSTKVDYCAKALSGERVFYLLEGFKRRTCVLLVGICLSGSG